MVDSEVDFMLLAGGDFFAFDYIRQNLRFATKTFFIQCRVYGLS